MKGGTIAAFAVGLIALAVLGWLWRERTAESPSLAPRAAQAGANVEAREGLRPTPAAAAPPLLAAGNRAGPRRRDPEERARARQSADATRARLRALQARRDSEKHTPSPGATAAAAPASMPPPEGTGNQARKPLGDYVRGLLQDEFIPLGKACYQELLERSPHAAGRLTLKVVVTGDPTVGGVVDDVDVSSTPGFADETLLTCIRESMYSVQFDAPPPGHPKLDFEYPLNFSPFPPDAGD